MKKFLSTLFLPFYLFSCGPNYSKTKIYEFLVENQLENKTVEVVPMSNTNFWITSNENYIVVPGERIIIGSKISYDDNKKATDIYRSDDIIEPFDIYVDNIKQEKVLSFRKFWSFSLGKVNESGKYTLIISENILNN